MIGVLEITIERLQEVTQERSPENSKDKVHRVVGVLGVAVDLMVEVDMGRMYATSVDS